MPSVICALKNVGFEIEKYYAAEIDENAKRVAYFNHGTIIEHVGDVRKLVGNQLRMLGRIDLLYSGSPCNELSKANPNRKGVDGILHIKPLLVLPYQ